MNSPKILLTAFLAAAAIPALSADIADDKFRQLNELLPTANNYRTASGAPGHQYWQQRADYVIRASLDEKNRRISGSEQVTYHNNSPDTLNYLWLQVDQNTYRPDSDHNTAAPIKNKESWVKPKESAEPFADTNVSYNTIRNEFFWRDFPGGFDIKSVSASGKPLRYTVVKTMMRIDLPTPLKSGEKFVFNVEWAFNVMDQKTGSRRMGFEYFAEDKNTIFEIAQWYPRMAAYYDVAGWQHKQYLGTGEFTLEFGDYDVQLTLPSDHVLAATGELQNPAAVLSTAQQERLKKARSASQPVVIVSQEEAEAAEKKVADTSKTWHFKASNVRDFAWASSRKFIWDAQGYKKGGTDMIAMSYYPKEANPLWGKYSTAAVIHTIDSYNQYTFDYPYPVAISVNGGESGMEYPMISFNGRRPVKDKKTGELTYSKSAKYGLVGVIIHEVGHNYFPMIVNSDERQWTWMDEGINTFVQSIAQRAWDSEFPEPRGTPRKVVDYMRSTMQEPIMTNSESIRNLGQNSYAKPAAGLTILRETILGRELFDFAFREYARRWKFKRPTPADFFRTMEDASGVDLDWFWRGWFYTTDAVDIAIDNVQEFTLSTKDPEVEKALKKQRDNAEPVAPWIANDKGIKKRIESQPELKDFYNEHDDYTVTNKDRNRYTEVLDGLEDWEKALLKQQGKYFYLVDFSNLGGMLMPLILEIETKDGKKSIQRVPVEIWRYSPKKVTKLIITDSPLVSIVQDPFWETADVDQSNNAWPRRVQPSRLELFKSNREAGENNLMRDIKTPLKAPAKADAKP